MTHGAPVIICSKSTWLPSIRREHALARLAAGDGHRVLFIERPSDVRHIASLGPTSFARRLRAHGCAEVEEGVFVAPRATPVPGHRSATAERIETRLLGGVVRRWSRRLGEGGVAVVVTTPWQWAAVRDASPASRLVYDCADDWAVLTPHRHGAFAERYADIARRAAVVVAASSWLAGRFPGGNVVVVPNATDDELVAASASSSRRHRTMCYVGTISERVDLELCARLLRELPGWTLDLYGPCQYPRLGGKPSGELVRFLDRSRGRAWWHGPIPRSALAAVIDSSAVCLLPFAEGLATGSIMKLFDYAARGRPIVSTRWNDVPLDPEPPRLYFADPDEIAKTVQAAASEPEAYGAERRRWAAENRWSARWPAWSRAVFGT